MTLYVYNNSLSLYRQCTVIIAKIKRNMLQICNNRYIMVHTSNKILIQEYPFTKQQRKYVALWR